MGKGRELTTTITLEGGVGESLKKAFDKASGMADKTSKHIGGVMSKMGGFASGAMKAGLAAAATGITALGTASIAGAKAALDLGQSFESASNTIRVGTGATGEDLEKLNASFDEVYKSVPTTMEAASQTIADWNTRLGVTGDTLETLSKQSLYVSDMMGEDLNGVIESSSQALKQWNIDAGEMGGEMDYIFKVSQNTGMGFNALMGHMQSSGAVLQDLGYNFDEAAVMIANLDKAGINTEQVLKGMKKGLGNIAKDGGDAVAAMNGYAEAIRNAKSESEAITIATDIFGSATAVTMAQAIRTGAMDVDALTASLKANDETIMKAAEDTETFPQKLQKLKATTEVALKPMAGAFMDMANNAIPLISNAVEDILPEVQGFLGQLAPVFGDAVNAIIPVLSGVVQKVTPILKNALAMVPGIVSNIKGVISNIMPVVNNAIPMIEQGISGIINGVQQAMPFIEGVISAALPALQAIGSAVMSLGQTFAESILPVLQQAGATLMSMLAPVITQIFNTIQTLMPVVVPFLQSAMTMLGALYQNVLMPIGTFLAGQMVANIQNILTVFTPVISGIITALKGVLDFLTGVFTGDWNKAWEGIKTVFTGIWEAMKGVVKGVLNGIINGINKIIGGINGTIGAAGEVIGIKAKIPLIPQAAFAKGGVVTSPTVAMVGEGGVPETIIPHTNTAESRRLLANAARSILGNGTTIQGGSNDSRTFNITYSPTIYGAGLTENNLQDNFEEFKRFMSRYLAEDGREVYA